MAALSAERYLAANNLLVEFHQVLLSNSNFSLVESLVKLGRIACVCVSSPAARSVAAKN